MSKTITIGEVIAYVDNIKPNTRTSDEKRLWLNDIDTMIKEDIIDTHEGGESVDFIGYTEDSSDDTELLVPAHYGRDMYSFYLMMKIDTINNETAKYNNNASMFQSVYNGFLVHYNQTHKPLQKHSIINEFSTVTEVNCYANPLSSN